MATKKQLLHDRRKVRVKAVIKASAKHPILVVSRSLNFITAQIKEADGTILVSASDMKDTAKGTKTERATRVGTEIAKKAIEQNITQIVFDRNGYKYHGRVKALAEAAREAGLKF